MLVKQSCMPYQFKILHITPHLGGGVGSVVLDWIRKDFFENIHTVVSLDKNKNLDWRTIYKKNVTFYDNFYKKKDLIPDLSKKTKYADIIILHWWNHPLLYDIIINFTWPVCRLVAWNHASGLYPPYTIPLKTIEFVDIFIHTSPVSYESQNIKVLSDSQKKKIRHIWSTTELTQYDSLQHMPQKKFTVGFMGTADFAKLHPQFIEMCLNVSRKNIQFVVCSGDSQEHLVQQAELSGKRDKFLFRGKGNPKEEFPCYDVFGYPLQPNHFGTCEQVLGEAMMAGCVPVVLNNPAERYIVDHKKTGIIANSPEEYSRWIEYLYDHPDFVKELAANARIAAREKYDLNKTISRWNKVFSEMMTSPKKTRTWDDKNYKRSPAQLYAESLGEYGKPFFDYLHAQKDDEKNNAEQKIRELFQTNLMFASKSKGSVLQYLQFFPDDVALKAWSNLLN